MAVDEEGLARRASAKKMFSVEKMKELAAKKNQTRCFSNTGWKRGIAEEEKLNFCRKALSALGSYEEKSRSGKRPEEVEPAWKAANRRCARWGIHSGCYSLVQNDNRHR